jgi:hypothetical protein
VWNCVKYVWECPIVSKEWLATLVHTNDLSLKKVGSIEVFRRYNDAK